MFIIDSTYFTGEISIPELPMTREQQMATYGVALMTQTAGENVLEDFIDQKTTEYLRYMFGEDLCNDLANSWYNYVNDIDEPISNELATPITDLTSRNVWINIPYDTAQGVVVDLIYSDFKLKQFLPPNTVYNAVSVMRFGNQKTWLFEIDGVKIRIRLLGKKLEYLVGSGVINNELDIIETHKIETPEERFRILLNVLTLYQGKQKVSPIANYVWYWLNRDASNHATVTGEADLNFSRATANYETDKYLKAVAISQKLIRSWNAMCTLNEDVIRTIHRNIGLFRKDYRIPTAKHRMLVSTQNVFNI